MHLLTPDKLIYLVYAFVFVVGGAFLSHLFSYIGHIRKQNSDYRLSIRILACLPPKDRQSILERLRHE